MLTRYLSNPVVAVLGGFAVVASQAFAPSTFKWIMLGTGVVAVIAAAPFVARSARGRAQRALDALIAALGAWTIIASTVFSSATITWLGFASGVALVGLALIGLTLNELSNKIVVRPLPVNGRLDREFANAR